MRSIALNEGTELAEIRVEGLSKQFGGKRAVDDLNLKIEDKEFVVLLGPSGCGKTTTLYMMSGLERQTYGHIFFDGTLVDGLPPEKRDIAMVFQSYALYPHMTARDNLAFPLKIRGWSKEDIERQVKKAAEMLRIEEFLHRKPHTLSGGERQRVALGRAIVREPKAFLLDEPLANLDALLRTSMRVEIRKLHDELGITFVYVTHDQVEAMTMADKIAVMKDGRLQQFSAPHETYSSPANDFVASFLGNPPMNLIDGVLENAGGRISFRSEGFNWNIGAGEPSRFEQLFGTDVILGIRPEDISVSDEEKTSIQGIHSRIYMVEHLEPDCVLTLEIPGQENLMKARTKMSDEHKLRVGQFVSLEFLSDRVHLFEKKTGKTIM